MAKKQITRNDYHRRIALVIDYIHDHLDSDLSLDVLSKVACFSCYHWHRIYHSISGETVARTIRRLRLQRAANALIHTDISITRIARKAGYDNTDSFTRKFSEDFDLSPGAYRKRGQVILQKIYKPTNRKNDMYDVEIKMLDYITLATMEHSGSYLEIGRAFEKLMTWGQSQGLMSETTRTFGVYLSDPNSVPVDQLCSKAGFMVEPDFTDKDQVSRYVLDGGKYAMIIHKGAYSELEAAYQWIFGTWLVNSDEEPDDKPVVEEYLNNPREVPPAELLTAIYLPLV